MKKLKKLSIKKITVSNLSDETAREIHGGLPTAGICTNVSCAAGTPCTNDCHTNNCASNTDNANCTQAAGGCTAGQACPSANNTCFTQWDCTYGHCTDVANYCALTYKDATCVDYTCPHA